MVSQWNSSGISSQDSPHWSSVHKVQELLSKIERNNQRNFTGRIIFMSMFNDISWGSKDNEKECELSAQLVSHYVRKDFHQDNGHSSDLDQKRSGTILLTIDRPQGEWDRVAEQMMLTFAESGHPVFRCHESIIHEECSRARVVENCLYTHLCRWRDG